MESLGEVLAELEKKGSEGTRKTLARHGVTGEMFGVRVGDLKVIAKKIKGKQELAYELYETGNYDAMYLAGIGVDGSRMTKRQIEAWAKSAPCDPIAAYIVPWVATESPWARELALKWIGSKSERIATSGWNTYAGILATTDDAELDLGEIKELLGRVMEKIVTAPNRVRYAMNGFVISVGAYVRPLLADAKRAARAIGTVEVDMGDTACKVPHALSDIEKIEKMGRVGKKRKTMRC